MKSKDSIPSEKTKSNAYLKLFREICLPKAPADKPIRTHFVISRKEQLDENQKQEGFFNIHLI